MSANKNVFCNTPWYELQIYWDGSFGICCQESHKLHNDDQRYNIANMTINEWFNSDQVKKFRLEMFDNQMSSACSVCEWEEDHNNNTNSRRIRGMHKSVIFMSAFDASFQQSPGFKHFEHSRQNQGHTTTQPIDLHVDLGNYCNLACKMCNPRASSTIASQHVKWGIVSDQKYVGQNWTKDPVVWQSFKDQILAISRLNNIHFMGGETLLTDRFDDFVDSMIEARRFDLCFSFVTNGTVYKPELIEKLKKFRRVGIEISIEAVDDINAYVRQGTDTQKVIDNIQRYVSKCNNTSVTVTLRPAPSLLTIGSYVTLLEFALKHQLLIKANYCVTPEFLNIRYLPDNAKKLYIQKYQQFLDTMQPSHSPVEFSASDPNYYQTVIYNYAKTCIEMLSTPAPADSDQRHRQLVEHCRRWDNVYKLNARTLYPELENIWDQYEY